MEKWRPISQTRPGCSLDWAEPARVAYSNTCSPQRVPRRGRKAPPPQAADHLPFSSTVGLSAGAVGGSMGTPIRAACRSDCACGSGMIVKLPCVMVLAWSWVRPIL